MTAAGYALFDTAIGWCALGWAEAGITQVSLPEASPAATRRRIADRLPGAVEQQPPASTREVIQRITALFDGSGDDLADVELDLSGVGGFHRSVYEVTRAILPGTTLSYGAIAAELRLPGAARAVGRALGHNPCPIIVPCHRVLAADGSMHGFSANGGVATKRRMLQLEGALPADEPTLF
ncbi:MAG TPA: methylated-DNA--[protein]-cysteine S-methyltransferase [Jatrophihabitans sp.]|jgi:methylated-DNA-[protein]-cysteine S-methyltransferase|uniref:methylated-DNA--[protein]-cysteine S-methyltransferase n=1 Tax=Jatrophihabitans sp. TaxID=1932789 RepID=UPI002F258C48